MVKGSLKKILLALGMVGAGAAGAFAITAPTTGSFAYDLYDITVNKLLKGPAGFVAGVGAIIYGAASLITGKVMPAVLGVLGGATLIKADAITSSLGLTF